MQYEDYEVPKVTPMSHEEIMRSVGRNALRVIVKVSQPTPEEVNQMLMLAEELN